MVVTSISRRILSLLVCTLLFPTVTLAAPRSIFSFRPESHSDEVFAVSSDYNAIYHGCSPSENLHTLATRLHQEYRFLANLESPDDDAMIARSVASFNKALANWSAEAALRMRGRPEDRLRNHKIYAGETLKSLFDEMTFLSPQVAEKFLKIWVDEIQKIENKIQYQAAQQYRRLERHRFTKYVDFGIGTIVGTVVATWVYNKTGGVLAADSSGLASTFAAFGLLYRYFPGPYRAGREIQKHRMVFEMMEQIERMLQANVLGCRNDLSESNELGEQQPD